MCGRRGLSVRIGENWRRMRKRFAATTLDGALAKALFAKLGIGKSVQESDIAEIAEMVRKRCCRIHRLVWTYPGRRFRGLSDTCLAMLTDSFRPDIAESACQLSVCQLPIEKNNPPQRVVLLTGDQPDQSFDGNKRLNEKRQSAEGKTTRRSPGSFTSTRPAPHRSSARPRFR